jgi:hypothetical protein
MRRSNGFHQKGRVSSEKREVQEGLPRNSELLNRLVGIRVWTCFCRYAHLLEWRQLRLHVPSGRGKSALRIPITSSEENAHVLLRDFPEFPEVGSGILKSSHTVCNLIVLGAEISRRPRCFRKWSITLVMVTQEPHSWSDQRRLMSPSNLSLSSAVLVDVIRDQSSFSFSRPTRL